jgi:hypothetical protein
MIRILLKEGSGIKPEAVQVEYRSGRGRTSSTRRTGDVSGRSRVRRGPPFDRDLLRRTDHVGDLRDICARPGILLRHGLGMYVFTRQRPGLSSEAGRRRLARSLAEALDDAGVTFVKLG